jgi:hypothetical protein
MSYNIFAETDKKINWEELYKEMMPQILVEYVPMPNIGINGGDALGISIPSKNVGIEAWEKLELIMNVLIEKYQFDLYDMYNGVRINKDSFNKIKENLLT